MSDSRNARTAIVAIGRNEGDRLRACLASLPTDAAAVYVDSGSTDDSVAYARSRGVTIVELPPEPAFTAARARNAGLAALDAGAAGAEFVQMVDGDCTLDPAWIDTAVEALDADPTLAAVFGRRRERFPDASIYNCLCDDEWNTPIGFALSCGGDALFRREALAQVGGYAPELIAGEEPDMCLRMRRRGWRIRRIDAEMTMHDAAMTRFSQWWKRAERGGYAATNLHWRHRSAGDGYGDRQLYANAVWLGLLPLLTIIATVRFGWIGLLPLLLYPLQMARIAWRSRREGRDWRTALVRGLLFTLGKVPGSIGTARFYARTLLRRRATLIEYK